MRSPFGADFFIRKKAFLKKCKPGLSLDQHHKLGLELYDMRECLVEAVQQLSESYHIKTGVARKAHQTLLMVDELRAAMDKLLKREHAGEKQETLRTIYYPGLKSLAKQ